MAQVSQGWCTGRFALGHTAMSERALGFPFAQGTSASFPTFSELDQRGEL